MKNKPITRRDFVKTTAIGTTAVLAGCKLANSGAAYNPHDLPTTVLGKTGVRIPRLALGCGSRFLSASTEEGIEMLNHALDHGLYYWDTANSYVNRSTKETSEERLGIVLKHRRKEVFLATKLGAREPDELQRQLETSLKRLQTDRVELLKSFQPMSREEMDRMAVAHEPFYRSKQLDWLQLGYQDGVLV